MSAIQSPRRHPPLSSRWYGFYAMFSAQFVASAFRRVGISKSDRLLDPWNGTGTTTAAAWQGGNQRRRLRHQSCYSRNSSSAVAAAYRSSSPTRSGQDTPEDEKASKYTPERARSTPPLLSSGRRPAHSWSRASVASISRTGRRSAIQSHDVVGAMQPPACLSLRRPLSKRTHFVWLIYHIESVVMCFSALETA